MIQIISITLILSLITTSVQLLLKKGVSLLGEINLSLSNIIPLAWSVLSNLYMLGSLALLAISFLLWLLLLSRGQLNTAYPILISLNIISLLIASRLFFHETLSLPQMIGMAGIIVSIILILKG